MSDPFEFTFLDKRRDKMNWKKAILASSFLGLLALVYCVSNLFFFTEVPAINNIELTPNWTMQLPFAISRWTDIPVIMIFPILINLVLRSKKFTKNERADIISGVMFGLMALIIILPVTDIVFKNLFFLLRLTVNVIGGLCVFLFCVKKLGGKYGLIVLIGYSATVSIVTSLPVSLVIAFIVNLFVVSSVLLIYGILRVFLNLLFFPKEVYRIKPRDND